MLEGFQEPCGIFLATAIFDLSFISFNNKTDILSYITLQQILVLRKAELLMDFSVLNQAFKLKHGKYSLVRYTELTPTPLSQTHKHLTTWLYN